MLYFNANAAKHACVKWIQDWFKENGDGCNAIVGISGGKNSSVVAALCVEALGKDRVIGVMMPCDYQRDINDSVSLITHLKIPFTEVNIFDAYKGVVENISNLFTMQDSGWYAGEFIKISDQTKINLPARIRMATLYAVSQSVNGRVANTCNLSENYIGYSTRWGDSVGDFAPLANLTCSEVVQLGEALGLPDELIHKTPSDGLCGKSDEDNFGFTYAELDRYILEEECDDPAVAEKIDRMHRKNMFKLRPIPEFDPYFEKDIYTTVLM